MTTTLEDFIDANGLKVLVLPDPLTPLPPWAHPRYGFKAYKVTLRSENLQGSFGMPFFSTDEPYTYSFLKSLLGDARLAANPVDLDLDDPEDAAILREAQAQSDKLRAYLGDDLYDELVEIDPEVL